jgi:hypothetical protein
MDLLKNHYEKIILGVVLIGVIFFTALLPGKITSTRQELELILKAPETGPGRPAEPVDLSLFEQALQAVAQPQTLKLSGEHNLFNPVRWRRLAPNQPIKPDTQGNLDAQQFQVTEIRPLTFAIWFDSVRGSGSSMRYQFMLLNEAAASPSARRPVPRTLAPAVGQKNEVFTIVEIRGPVQDPNEVVLELVADKQVVTVGRGRERSYQKIVGYEADGIYPPANRTFKGLRVNYPVVLSEPWKVIAIDQSSITIESPRTQKRETKQLASATNP